MRGNLMALVWKDRQDVNIDKYA